jgi:16S rRNA (uracil1498-N3)-methyltransferase
MNRFFVREIIDQLAILEQDDYKHCKTVLRLREDDEIFIVHDEKEHTASLIGYENGKAVFKILRETGTNREATVQITLYQCLPKGTKMESVIQKNVEAGVHRIVPVVSKRTIAKIEDDKHKLKKLDRWRRIAEESAKQSMRNVVPQVDTVLSFEQMVYELRTDDGLLIVPYEKTDEKSIAMKEITVREEKINVVIGPEGGFSAEEIESLIEVGAKVVTLGNRIFRTETAGLVTVAVLMYKTNNI